MELKPYYIKFNIVDQTFLFTSTLSIGYILKDAKKYSELINKLDILDLEILETFLIKFRESKLNQPLILSLEEEIALYTCLHLTTAYTTTDLFLNFVSEKTKQKREIIPWKKKRAKDS